MAATGCVDNYVKRYVGLAGSSCECMLALLVVHWLFLFVSSGGRRAWGDRTQEALGFVF